MRLLAVAALALLLAGCAAQPPAPLASIGPAAPEFELDGQRCTIGGGHSVLDNDGAEQVIPPPWKVADVLDDIGPQAAYSLGLGSQPVPSKGHTWGNWHVTAQCEAWQLDGAPLPGLVFGFVVAKVERPAFDAGPAGPRYILSVLATSDPGMQARLHAAGIHATLAHRGAAGWLEPDVFHNVLDTQDHGAYEALFRTRDVGPMDPAFTRLWWQRADADGAFTPVALDLGTRGGEHLWAEPNGWFQHTNTTDHDPLPAAAANTAGLVYRGLDMQLRLGPVADARLGKAYVHL